MVQQLTDKNSTDIARRAVSLRLLSFSLKLQVRYVFQTHTINVLPKT